MKNIDIIVMGKTGSGKSTLINAVLEEDLAPTGTGQAVTKQNKIYSKKMLLPVGGDGSRQYGFISCQMNMYDTVGLEIDSLITDTTLKEIRKHIEETKLKMSLDDLHLVWFCVNDRSSRFEKYEQELIRKLSIEYEIPFVIVLTQSFSEERGELGIKIQNTVPEIPQKRILAKDYKTRGGSISAFGVSELIKTSVNDYKHLKIDVLEKKLNLIDNRRKEKIEKIKKDGNEIIKKHTSMARKIGFVPGGCIPIIHGICIKMISNLNNLAGFRGGKGFAVEIFSEIIFGMIITPLMAVPLLSTKVAETYIQAAGEFYFEAVLNVLDQSSDKELMDNTLIKERLKAELKKLK